MASFLHSEMCKWWILDCIKIDFHEWIKKTKLKQTNSRKECNWNGNKKTSDEKIKMEEEKFTYIDSCACNESCIGQEMADDEMRSKKGNNAPRKKEHRILIYIGI